MNLQQLSRTCLTIALTQLVGLALGQTKVWMKGDPYRPHPVPRPLLLRPGSTSLAKRMRDRVWPANLQCLLLLLQFRSTVPEYIHRSILPIKQWRTPALKEHPTGMQIPRRCVT